MYVVRPVDGYNVTKFSGPNLYKKMLGIFIYIYIYKATPIFTNV